MIEVVLAPNPGPFTGPGTNTYIVASQGDAIVIDPGPVDSGHMAEIIARLSGLTPTAVVVTHTHPDHAPMANPLAKALEVPAIGYDAGPSFVPDQKLGDGASLPVGGLEVVAVHTPGHTADHLCFRVDQILLTGDHIMGGSTVVIEDAAAYMDSLYKVREFDVTRIEPGHGTAMDDAGRVIDDYIEHRVMREKQLIGAVRAGARTVGDLVDSVYGDVPAELRWAAKHQVVVQLTKLSQDGAIEFQPGGAYEATIVDVVS